MTAIDQCAAVFDRHRTTTIQRIGLYDSCPCSRRGHCLVVRKDGHTVRMCRAHAKLAVQGFVSETGEVCDKQTRSDYQSGKVGWTTPHVGLWTCDEYPDEAAVFAADLKRRCQGYRRWRATR